jgi:hypothetical protein
MSAWVVCVVVKRGLGTGLEPIPTQKTGLMSPISRDITVRSLWENPARDLSDLLFEASPIQE